MAWTAAYKTRAPSEAIVFVVGGSTYEEAKAVAEWNSKQGSSSSNSSTAASGGSTATGGLSGQSGPMRVLLGGSSILNSGMFLSALGAGGGGSGA